MFYDYEQFADQIKKKLKKVLKSWNYTFHKCIPI